MSGYRVPFTDAETEFTEKRSRFLTNLWRVESEAEARAKIEEVRRRHYDARHHCWCYLLREGGVVRYSDDGEPQGTAGQPMLNVFQRQEVTNVCCVVTRYFGGVLLGAGGLARAYGRGAKDGLEAAGTAWVSRWTLWDVPCPYPLLERREAPWPASARGHPESPGGGAKNRRISREKEGCVFPENAYTGNSELP